MMKPTDEQLKDPKWWDENAPKSATHRSAKTGAWFQIVAGSVWEWIDDGWMPKELISRPTKPAAPEWDGEGYPPVGCECEMKLPNSDWLRGTVKYINKCGVVFKPWGTALESFISTATTSMEFRPLRTKEQRERDELAGLIDDAQMSLGSFWTPQKAAEIILSRYNLEPKQ